MSTFWFRCRSCGRAWHAARVAHTAVAENPWVNLDSTPRSPPRCDVFSAQQGHNLIPLFGPVREVHVQVACHIFRPLTDFRRGHFLWTRGFHTRQPDGRAAAPDAPHATKEFLMAKRKKWSGDRTAPTIPGNVARSARINIAFLHGRGLAHPRQADPANAAGRVPAGRPAPGRSPHEASRRPRRCWSCCGTCSCRASPSMA